MNTDIPDRATAGERRIVDPRSWTALSVVTELQMSQSRGSDAAIRDPLTGAQHALVIAKVLGNTELDVRLPRRSQHGLHLFQIHPEGLFAENRFSMPKREKDVLQMKSIG